MSNRENRNIKNIVAQFFDINAGCNIELFGTGLINDTYKVIVPGELTVLLQRINHYVFKQPEVVIENIRKIANHLQKHYYQMVILKPAATRQGSLFYKDLEGNYWRMYPFFERTISIDGSTNSQQVYQAGKAYGEFAYALSGLDPKTAGIEESIADFHNSVARLLYFEDVLATNIAGRLAEAAPEVGMIKANQHLFFYIAGLPTPLRITHNDTKINNVLFDQVTGEIRGVIDWDTVMPGTILSDFGDMVRTMTPTYDENYRNISEIDIIIPYFEALCRGFIPAVRPILTPVERDNLVKGAQWIVLEQALRFLTDYINGDVYYKITYPEQNLIRARNQLALYEALKRVEKDLEVIIQQTYNND